jgi:NAD(P)H dehydrogenase (quinone)
MRYIITGADGQLGGKVAANMLVAVPASELVFTFPSLSRLPEPKKQAWTEAGVTLREADYDNREQLIRAFEGGERIFFVSSIVNGPRRVRQHTNVVEAILEAGLEHITYTSFLGANRPGYDQYVVPDHTITEKLIAESGLAHNIMRNNLYMENYLLNSVMLANISDYRWVTPAGEGRASFIAKDDSARVATALVLGKGAPHEDYDVTGGECISEREICALIADASGLPYEYLPVDEQEFQRYLEGLHIPWHTDGDYSRSPVPYCGEDLVTNEAAIRDGLMAVETDTVEKLTGRTPLTARDLVDTYNYVWKERISSFFEMVSRPETKP